MCYSPQWQSLFLFNFNNTLYFCISSRKWIHATESTPLKDSFYSYEVAWLINKERALFSPQKSDKFWVCPNSELQFYMMHHATKQKGKSFTLKMLAKYLSSSQLVFSVYFVVPKRTIYKVHDKSCMFNYYWWNEKKRCMLHAPHFAACTTLLLWRY